MSVDRFAPPTGYLDVPLVGPADQVAAAIKQHRRAGDLVAMTDPAMVFDEQGQPGVRVVVRLVRRTPAIAPAPARTVRRGWSTGAKVATLAGVALLLLLVAGYVAAQHAPGGDAGPAVLLLLVGVGVWVAVKLRGRKGKGCSGLHCSGCSH